MNSERYASSSYRRYVLFILMLVYAVNFIDRQLVVILQEPIKQELGVSDTQLGLLTGLAFALFYVICGIPIAHWSESRTRRNVVTCAVALWSLMTSLSGLAQSYTQLLLARIGVGVGESGGSPPSHSMISDMYPAQQRSTALSFYSIGVNVGVLAGFLLGGWINEFFGWRKAFMVLGIPGLLLALLLFLSVDEPRRGMSDAVEDAAETPSLPEAIKLLCARPTFVFVSLAAGLQAFGMYGAGNFFPSYMIRIHGMGTGELGTWLALMSGGIGSLGAVAGGYLTDRLGLRERRWYLWLPMSAGLLAAPLSFCAFFAPTPYMALTLSIVPTFLHYMYLGPVLAVTHSLVGSRMRAFSSALLFFVLNLIGMGMGPLFTGFVSDSLQPAYGVDSLRYALAATLCIATVGATLMYALGAYHLRADVARAPV